MHSLATLHQLNARPVPQASVETRASSAVASRDGVVVHSAQLRSTCFLRHCAPRQWLERWNRLTPQQQHLIANRLCLNAQ